MALTTGANSLCSLTICQLRLSVVEISRVSAGPKPSHETKTPAILPVEAHVKIHIKNAEKKGYHFPN